MKFLGMVRYVQSGKRLESHEDVPGMIREQIYTYLDDVLIFSDSEKEHTEHVLKVLRRLRDRGLQVDIDKCDFDTREIKYLGLIVTTAGIRMDPEKVAAIREWQTPSSVKDVLSFVNFAGFYRRFIYRFSHRFLRYQLGVACGICSNRSALIAGVDTSTFFIHLFDDAEIDTNYGDSKPEKMSVHLHSGMVYDCIRVQLVRDGPLPYMGIIRQVTELHIIHGDMQWSVGDTQNDHPWTASLPVNSLNSREFYIYAYVDVKYRRRGPAGA
ncbi:uncharacterized protein KD926_007457 [Aspergillus affinis]|uniref:uncharacterized protein n=1 Tax=Aspergillus affinis TaxID=1070780 RepID=UPI0022FE0346|nr:uncharacterized protein KD926_007457 [Aspergillus affinis]KAI9041041.1 hypothetical protein KD926_007457 [Aspergillus affinis]